MCTMYCMLCEVDKAKLTIRSRRRPGWLRRPVHYSSNQCVQCIACYVRWTRQSLLSEAEECQADSEDQFIIVVTNVYNVLHVTWGGQGKAYYPKQKKARLTPKTSSMACRTSTLQVFGDRYFRNGNANSSAKIWQKRKFTCKNKNMVFT